MADPYKESRIIQTNPSDITIYPTKHISSSPRTKKRKKRNLRRSLPSYGWIPDPEVYMCIQKKKPIKPSKIKKLKKIQKN
jgi:hypothetical protein